MALGILSIRTSNIVKMTPMIVRALSGLQTEPIIMAVAL